MLAYEAACANGAPGVETKLTKLAGMKAIRSDNNRREMERGGQTEQRKEKKKANYGKIVDDTDTIWCGGDVSVGPRTVLLVI
jgi:hypothetical protein